MQTLKELTQHQHQLAEQHKFTQALLQKRLPVGAYSTYLANQFLQYYKLEFCARELLQPKPELLRSHKLYKDFLELQPQFTTIFTSTVEYCKHVNALPQQKLWAHIYTKHLGDLYGGQLLASRVPGSAKSYVFEDRPGLIAWIREHVNTTLAAEANWCFQQTIKLFDEIAYEYDL